jgi:hypothetical protein
VVDGLVPVASKLPSGTIRGISWSYQFSVATDAGLDAIWRENNNFSAVGHPYTNYSRRGEAWRLPGQTIATKLSDNGRRRFALLILQHLHQFEDTRLWFNLGRFDREERLYDRQFVRTPLQTFLMTAPWFPITTRDEDDFTKVSTAWLLTDRRNDPKFVPRAPDDIAACLDIDGKPFKILSQRQFGLQIWKTPSTAASRLRVLAKVCENLEQRDRASFRKQYDQAWRELAESGRPLEPTPGVAVEKPGGFGILSGGKPAPQVFVRSGRDRDKTKLLIDSGAFVLAGGGEVDAETVVSLLNGMGQFQARLVDQGDVQLLADGAVFQTSLHDPLLVDQVRWLADALVLGHKIGARDLDKVIVVASLEERLRHVRVRLCESIVLSPRNGPPKVLRRYMYQDEHHPTLIVAGDLDAQQLADSATQLSSLLHSNLRSFEPLLLRLAPRLPRDQPLSDIPGPTETDYAVGLQVDVEVVHENLASRRTDRSRLVPLITPVIAYFAGTAAALQAEAALTGEAQGDWLVRLQRLIPLELVQPLLDLLGITEDLAAIRRELELDYGRFNLTKSLGTWGVGRYLASPSSSDFLRCGRVIWLRV